MDFSRVSDDDLRLFKKDHPDRRMKTAARKELKKRRESGFHL